MSQARIHGHSAVTSPKERLSGYSGGKDPLLKGGIFPVAPATQSQPEYQSIVLPTYDNAEEYLAAQAALDEPDCMLQGPRDFKPQALAPKVFRSLTLTATLTLAIHLNPNVRCSGLRWVEAT